jgi:S1-C subfamily serine protease
MKWNIPIALLFAGTMSLPGYETLESDYRLNGTLMHAVVERARQSLQEFSAVVYDGRKEIAYGVVMSEDGYIVTKWSEVKDAKELKLRIDETYYENVSFVSGDAQWDICVLKIEASELKSVLFADDSQIDEGSWVIANGATTRSVRRPEIGIISAPSREIEAEGGPVLGIEIIEEKGTLIAGEIPEASGSYKAGIRKGDKILKLNDQKISKSEDLVAFMKERKVGEEVEVSYSRKGKTTKVTVKLQGRADIFGIEKSRNDEMSGDFSKRRSGFPRVLQHDVPGNSRTVGGPLLDLEGKCIGMNIARANRAESFAIPMEEMREVSQRLIEQARLK